MSLSEFFVWQRYTAKHGPVSMQRRSEVLTAYVVSALANIHRGKNQRPHKLVDFLLWSQGKDDHVIDADNEGGFLSAAKALQKSTPPRKESGQRKRLWVKTDGNKKPGHPDD